MSDEEFLITTLEPEEYEVSDAYLDGLRRSGASEEFIAKIAPDVHTVPHDGHWAVKLEGSSDVRSEAATQAEAVEIGRRLAEERGVEHVVYGPDGQVVERRSFDNGR